MRQPFIIMLFALIVPFSALARNYDAVFNGNNPQQTIEIISKATGYDFVYQSGLFDDISSKVYGTFNGVSLKKLLDKTLSDQLGLSYVIVDKSISLKKMPSGRIQSRVSGTVLDETGEPLAGAAVVIQGTSIGVVTDVDGNFAMDINNDSPVLVVNYVGMHPSIQRLSKSNIGKHLKIVLKHNASVMDEVVVTGYQNIKRENATGAFQTITADDLDKRYTSNIIQNLEGAVPGLVLSKNANDLGDDKMVIRGTGTFNARRAPLIVVDGLPIEGGIESINPYEISNITVLKDAAAAAIYGARATNGVIVVSTKQAANERVKVEFNADITVSERQSYDNFDWADAGQMIKLERYNFNAMRDDEDQSAFKNLINGYTGGRVQGMTPVTRLLVENHRGDISDEILESKLSQWSKNDYRRQYREIAERQRVEQSYNLAVRVLCRNLASSMVVNYRDNNRGAYKEHEHTLQYKYKGDLKVASWLDLSFGVEVRNKASKYRSGVDGLGINAFLPYQSIYNEDGTYAELERDIYLKEPNLGNAELELKPVGFSTHDELNRNFTKSDYTNIRTHIHSLFRIMPGWTAQAQFQYEDISSRSRRLRENDSYYMRYLYNLYTSSTQVKKWVDDPDAFDNIDWDDPNVWDIITQPNFGKKEITVNETTHHIPDGGLLTTSHVHGVHYTFRGQTRYNNTFGKHFVDALAGMEYRQTHSWDSSDIRYGYNPLTLNNGNMATDWDYITSPGKSALGNEYRVQGAPRLPDKDGDILHRYYSVYFTGNYVFDSRYSLSGSWRVDKTDLFGSDPKFRGRPLWSVGASWNLHNESFMKAYTWLNALKLRASYGLTGNIDSNASSYLTAAIKNNWMNSLPMGVIKNAPYDQLRWEKTATTNIGIDYAFCGYRLSGSVDYYHKSGSDLLTETDMDPTLGLPDNVMTINAGNMVNTGVELQINANILPQKLRNSVGVNVYFNIAYNKNKVTGLNHIPPTASDYLYGYLREGYPRSSIFSFDYAGLIDNEDGTRSIGWRDHNGNIHSESIYESEFSEDDLIFHGSADPTVAASFTPEIKYAGFSLSAMFNFYGGHYMRAGNEKWNTYGNDLGYTSGATPSSCLRYWEGDVEAMPNGYKAYSTIGYDYAPYMNRSVYHADYLKISNIVLSYQFDRAFISKLRLRDLRLRAQINNVCTWARNPLGLDPEAVMGGISINRTPRSYTMSLLVNF